MKKVFIIIGFIAAIIAIILGATPLFKIAIFPLIIAFICTLSVFLMSKKEQVKSKSVKYIGILAIIALSLVVYKSAFTVAEVSNTEQIEQHEAQSKEESIELLEDLEIEDLEIEDLEIEDLEIEE